MVARRLDEIVEESLQKRELTRRDFLKGMFLLALSIGTGVGFAGCSSPSGQRVGFEPSSPQNTGYKLIYPDWTKPVPDDVIPHIIEIGKKYIEVWAPGDLTCNTDRGEVLAEDVKEGMIIIEFSTLNGFNWVIGDVSEHTNRERGFYAVKLRYFSKELARFMEFVNDNMTNYGTIFIEGKSGDGAYGNYTFIEQGGGKVASAVVVQDVKNPENYQFYAFHDKNKLDKMMIEILSHPTGYKPAKHPERWYIGPEAMLKKKLEELRRI